MSQGNGLKEKVFCVAETNLIFRAMSRIKTSNNSTSSETCSC